jgi:AcrR family transcriptional regulator
LKNADAPANFLRAGVLGMDAPMARPLADPNLDRRIAMAVFELVARHGVDGLGVRLVAEAAGLSTGTLNYRFGNKQGLLLAAIDFAYRPPADFAAHAGSPRASLRRLARRYVLRQPKVRVWWRFYFAAVAHAAKDAEVAQRLAHNRRSLVLFFAAALAAEAAPGGPAAPRPEGAHEALLAPAPEAEEAAERLVALAHGLALRQLTEPGEATVAACECLLEAEIELACRSRTSVQLSEA